MKKTVYILGGGITGLASAYELKNMDTMLRLLKTQ